MDIKDKDITVWFSCGSASAVATYLTLKKYGKDNRVRVVNNPVKEEHEDNQRFLHDVEKWLGITIEYAVNEEFPDCSAETVWDKHKYMSGIAGAPCTMRLKKHARQQW
jgi:3'-phosphoadenosine 5'-phosphosulfate sulfotransferase (PAPS reductase)/FAD synthetase